MAIIPCGIVVREPVTAVDLLSWVYRDQKADVMSGRDLVADPPAPTCAPGAWPADRCAAFARAARLGHCIRGTGHLQRPALHADAETVHELVIDLSRRDPEGARLLRAHGRLGESPEAGDDPPRPAPVFRRTGNNRRKIVEDALLACDGREASGPYCPLRYSPSPECLAELRAEYRTWWNALAQLTAALPPLRRWRLTGLGAAEIPWAWGIAPFVAPDTRRSGHNPYSDGFQR